MRKQITTGISLGLLGHLLLGSFLSSAAYGQAEATYSDIEGHWAETCIRQLSQQDIVSGYPDGTFRPNNVLTRAEYAAMLTEAFPTVQPEREAIAFNDVPEDYWAREAIRTAYRRGFLSGYPGQTFQPNTLIPRAEAFVALASGLDYPTPAAPGQLLASTFADSGAIPSYAEAALAAATEQGILISPPTTGSEPMMNPAAPATRAQLAAALCEVKFQNSGVPAEYVVVPGQTDGGAPVTLGQTCTNPDLGYTIDYPVGWQTNPGEVINSCRVFDPEPIQLPERAETTDEAIHLRVDNIAFDRLTDEGISEQELSRETLTIDGRQAIATENAATGRGLLPQGMRFYQYVIDLGDRSFLATTYDVEGTQYERNRRILDQMIRTLEFN